MKKIVAAILICLLSFFCLAACNQEEAVVEDKKAIIVLPGIMGSALMQEGADTPFWDPLTADISLADFFDNPYLTLYNGIIAESENGTDLVELVTSIVQVEENSMFDLMQLDENGNSVKDVIPVPWEYEGRQRYSALNVYKPMWEIMNERYGDYYEVRVFNYDWRLDNRTSAAKLEKLINDNGYTDVILCAQSMGNCVVANYLGRSETNRNKVSAYCAFAGPFYGAYATINLLENPNAIIEALDGLDPNSIPIPQLSEFLSGIIDDVYTMYNDHCKEQILLSMPTIVQMLPNIELANSLQYAYGEEFINYDGTPITTNEELVEFYKSRPWAKKKDGTYKPYVADLLDYYNASYVEVGGEKVHSTSLVNTFYFAGTGVLTSDQIDYDDEGNFIGEVFHMLGDGTVPLYSAIPIENFDANNITADNVRIFEEYTHLDCGCVFSDELREAAYDFVDSAIPADILELITTAETEPETEE